MKLKQQHTETQTEKELSSGSVTEADTKGPFSVYRSLLQEIMERRGATETAYVIKALLSVRPIRKCGPLANSS